MNDSIKQLLSDSGWLRFLRTSKAHLQGQNLEKPRDSGPLKTSASAIKGQRVGHEDCSRKKMKLDHECGINR